MSTAYNRRRGAKANRSRKPRECFAANCTRIGTIGNYCDDHAAMPAPEGPIGRFFRLRHQANQQREDALLPRTCRRKRTCQQDGVKESAAAKVHNRKVRSFILFEGFRALFGLGAKKPKPSNPWAK